MDRQEFDRFTRRLAAVGPRREVLKRLAACSAAGLAFAIDRSGRAQVGDKVVVCHRTGSETNPVIQIVVSTSAIPAHEAHGDAIAPDFASDPNNCGGCGVVCVSGETCHGGQCESVQTCTAFILSGGPSPDETIGVDDDLTLYLNGTPIFINDDGFASELPPIYFSAQNGDELRVVATDVDPFCRGIDPLYLHCAATGAVQVLDADGQSDGCVTPGTRPPNFVFYDQIFTIAVP